METFQRMLFSVLCCCLVSGPTIDFVLIPLIWRANPSWAKARPIPRSGWERGWNTLLWRWSVMSFDQNLRVTKATCYLALLAGFADHVGLVCLLLLVILELFHG